MFRKLILICLIGLLGIVSLPGAGLAYSLSSDVNWQWLAQAESVSQPVSRSAPSTPGSLDASEVIAPSAADSSTSTQESSKQTPPSDQLPPIKSLTQTKPFNPYDMKALKQFDAGSHRAE
ncbi:MAG: hypothetical protein WBC73_13070 [Phormidesmis sp.]